MYTVAVFASPSNTRQRIASFSELGTWQSSVLYWRTVLMTCRHFTVTPCNLASTPSTVSSEGGRLFSCLTILIIPLKKSPEVSISMVAVTNSHPCSFPSAAALLSLVQAFLSCNMWGWGHSVRIELSRWTPRQAGREWLPYLSFGGGITSLNVGSDCGVTLLPYHCASSSISWVEGSSCWSLESRGITSACRHSVIGPSKFGSASRSNLTRLLYAAVAHDSWFGLLWPPSLNTCLRMKRQWETSNSSATPAICKKTVSARNSSGTGWIKGKNISSSCSLCFSPFATTWQPGSKSNVLPSSLFTKMHFASCRIGTILSIEDCWRFKYW